MLSTHAISLGVPCITCAWCRCTLRCLDLFCHALAFVHVAHTGGIFVASHSHLVDLCDSRVVMPDLCCGVVIFAVVARPHILLMLQHLLCRLQDMFRFARALHDVIASGACCVPRGHCFAQCCCAIGPSGTVAVRVSTSLKSRTRMLVIVLLGADNH